MAFLNQYWGLLLAFAYVCLLALVYASRDRLPLFGRLAGRKACVSSISIVLFLLLIFGLVPQDGSRDGFWGILGLRSMSRSPIFILALLALATTVTLNTIEDIHHFSRHRLGVTCAHLGLSVILVTGLFVTGGTVRTRMTAMPDVPNHKGLDESSNEYVKFPFELTLRSFSVQEYSSEVTLTLPDGHSSEVLIAVNHPLRVGSWWIYQSDYLMDAENGTFVSIFKCVHSPMSGVLRLALWLLLLCAAAMVFFPGFIPSFRGRKASPGRPSGDDSSGVTGIFKE